MTSTLSIPKINHLSKATPLPPPPEDNEFELQSENPCELHLSPEPKGVTTSKLPPVIEDDDTSVVVDEEDRQESTPEAELLMAHHRFQHISFSKLQEMAVKASYLGNWRNARSQLVQHACMERPQKELGNPNKKGKGKGIKL